MTYGIGVLLKQRSTAAEHFDSPDRSQDLVREDYRQLGRVNRLFRFADPFQHTIPEVLGEAACQDLTLLDMGAGDGSLGDTLETWAQQRLWNWQVTHLDLNPKALTLSKSSRRVVGSALALPFRDNSFDVVVAAQMTHHLDFPQGVVSHFKEAYRVARKLVVIYDLHRTLPMYMLVWGTLICMRSPKPFREDGLMSVKKGWRPTEWQDLARQAQIPDARVWVKHGTRVMLQATKPATL
jgi:ubiquinone/menaquinone biosynthesis C-methylase UbiE